MFQLKELEDCVLSSLYIDFDAFFANVEKQLVPEIRERPVGVTALASEYSAFITRCYMAKKYGIKRGMRVSEGRDLCKELVVRVARPDVYVDVHNRILDEIDRHLPVTKVWSVDEMECTLIGSERERAVQIASDIREGLAKNIGSFITPSIGLAPNQFLAKVAAEMEKPSGLVILRRVDLPGRLLNLSLTDLPGISGNMETRLNRSGVFTIQDLWALGPKHMRAIWGNIEGERMWAQLHGQIIVRPPTKTSMFGHSRVLTKGWRTPEGARKCLDLLTVKAAYRLRRAGYLCQALSVSVKLSNNQRPRFETSFAYCNDDPTLLHHMNRQFDNVETLINRRAMPKSVYVMLHNIAKPEEISGDLFDHADQEKASSHRWGKVMEAMDSLNVRHGRAIVHFGTRYDLPGGYAGGKIAFGRVPDKEDFF